MTHPLPTEASFLKDVSEHRMTVVRDDGPHRHLHFGKPGTGIEHFQIITWPGYLCYTGDMGTYVFRRLDDMFEFFRTDRHHTQKNGQQLYINPGYWSEKVEAADRHGHITEFSMEKFQATVLDRVASLVDDDEDWTDTKSAALINDLKDGVLAAEDEYEAIEAIRRFDHKGAEHLFEDWSERSTHEYTYRFLWCCYALAWAVKHYDAISAETVSHKNSVAA